MSVPSPSPSTDPSLGVSIPKLVYTYSAPAGTPASFTTSADSTWTMTLIDASYAQALLKLEFPTLTVSDKQALQLVKFLVLAKTGGVWIDYFNGDFVALDRLHLHYMHKTTVLSSYPVHFPDSALLKAIGFVWYDGLMMSKPANPFWSYVKNELEHPYYKDQWFVKLFFNENYISDRFATGSGALSEAVILSDKDVCTLPFALTVDVMDKPVLENHLKQEALAHGSATQAMCSLVENLSLVLFCVCVLLILLLIFLPRPEPRIVHVAPPSHVWNY